VGELISLMELQSVPYWDPDLIRHLIPLLKLSGEADRLPGIRQRWKEGNHTLTYRTGAKTTDSDTLRNRKPQLLIYRFSFRSLMQWGITLESDAGESRHPDYASAYVSMARKGYIRQLIAGDYTVSLGQGLIHWQGHAFGLGTGMLSSYRQGAVFKPHSGRDENRFHRGLALAIGKEKWEFSFFLSKQRIDANKMQDSSMQSISISSFPISGLHRTLQEREDKHAVNQTAGGGRLGWQSGNLRIFFNGMHTQFNYPVVKRDLPYNRYETTGKVYGNASLDATWFNNAGMFFTEWGVDRQLDRAITAGWLKSLDSKVDLSILYRNISPAYQAWQTNCLSQSGEAKNEKGLFINLVCAPSVAHRFEGFVDIYSHPWLKANIDGPSQGAAAAVQYQYKPNKKTELIIRWQQDNKSANILSSDQATRMLEQHRITRWRCHLSFTPHEPITMRIRHEISLVKTGQNTPEKGSLSYVEFIYKPMMRSYSMSLRFTLFDSGGYDSRIYAYERDLPAFHTIPAFFGKGTRIYSVVGWKWNKTIHLSAKWLADWRSAKLQQEWRLQISWQLNRDA
jgi:hypothetical protein